MFKYLYNIRQDKMEKYDLYMDDAAIINFLLWEFKKDSNISIELADKTYFKVTYKHILEQLPRLRFKSVAMLKIRFKHFKDIKLIERVDGTDASSFMRFNDDVLYELYEKAEDQ